MTEPTDAEILELASQYWHCLDETESATEIELVRAALAKWGQPAQAVEPVATVQTIHGVTVGYLETAVPVGTKLYTAPQPVAREPLTDEQVSHVIELFSCGDGKGHDVHGIARTIEAEVRKSDDALILQLVEALVECKDSTQERIDTLTESGIDKHKPRYFRSYVQDLQRAADAISAARARLEGKP